MSDAFFDRPILNSPYTYPNRHWELDGSGQPTQKVIETRRHVSLVTPIPKPRKRTGSNQGKQQEIELGDATGVGTVTQRYDPTPIINELRQHVDQWRKEPNPAYWQVTPETARLLQHWRHHQFSQQSVSLDLEHSKDTRISTVLMHLTKRLLYTKYRDEGEDPKLHLFGQLKRICKEWLDTRLVCKGGTYPAQLLIQELQDRACERIHAAITFAEMEKKRPIVALLDPYNPVGTTAFVNFTTSKTDRWQTKADRSHINWIILDSDWEAEFCRVAERHPKVLAYVKNHNLGFEVPYKAGAESRRYRPDFIVLVDDGHGKDDPLHLVVEIKGYRGEDAKDKKLTMETFWVPGVNHLKVHGRWAFAEFTAVFAIETDFAKAVESNFAAMLAQVAKGSP